MYFTKATGPCSRSVTFAPLSDDGKSNVPEGEHAPASGKNANGMSAQCEADLAKLIVGYADNLIVDGDGVCVSGAEVAAMAFQIVRRSLLQLRQSDVPRD